MKFISAKQLVLIFLLLAGAVAFISAKAATRQEDLGSSLVAADSYLFTCPAGTTQARIKVQDLSTRLNTAATVFATFGKFGTLTRSVFDTESTSGSSIFAINTTLPPGTYNLVVNKSAINVEDYVVTAECLKGTIPFIITLVLQTDQ